MNDETMAALDRLVTIVKERAPEHAGEILAAAAAVVIAATRHTADVAREAVAKAVQK